MKLLRLSYQDLSSGLSIDSCKFFPDLNLLVGISGAGKTSILKAISNLKRIANGASVNGVKWDVEFLTTEHIRYRWLGEFTSDKTIVSEYIYREDREIIKIENDQTWFNAQKICKLSPLYSVAELLILKPDLYPFEQNLIKLTHILMNILYDFITSIMVTPEKQS